MDEEKKAEIITEIANDIKNEAVKEIKEDRSMAMAMMDLVKDDSKTTNQNSKRWFIVAMTSIILSLLVIGAIVWHFTNKIEILNKQHLDYLSEYDFSGTSEIIVDGKDGTALYQDGEGNVINNGEGDKKGN